MSTEYRGVIVVGYEKLDIEDTLAGFPGSRLGWENYDFGDRCDALDLERFSPYVDADCEDCVFGYPVFECRGYQHSVISLSAQEAKAQQLVVDLENKFGVKPKIYLMAQGW